MISQVLSITKGFIVHLHRFLGTLVKSV